MDGRTLLRRHWASQACDVYYEHASTKNSSSKTVDSSLAVAKATAGLQARAARKEADAAARVARVDYTAQTCE